MRGWDGPNISLPSSVRWRATQLDVVLITHDHIDHVAGVPALRDRWPDVVVRGGARGVTESMAKSSRR